MSRSPVGRWASAVPALIWAGLLLTAGTPPIPERAAVAQPVARAAANLTSSADGIGLRIPSVIKAGAEIDADATLVIRGLLQPDADLHLFIDGIERRAERTDLQGTAHFRLAGFVAPGSHQVTATYNAGSRYAVTMSARSTFVIAPLIITVQTVPATPGVVIALDGGAGTPSDAGGKAVLGVARAGIHVLAVSLPANNPATRYSFSRWSDDSWEPIRAIRIDNDVALAVGLRIAYLTPIQFVNLDGHPLDESRVSDVVISGPNAEVQQVAYPFAPVWLQTPVPAKHTGENGLHITPAPYSLSFARYDGLSVASAGQMRYSPSAGGTWSISLLLFTLRLDAKDALFGTSLRESIRLIGPSGPARLVNLDSSGSATLVLARGNYAAQVQAAGMAPFATIALSRSQTVIVPVITPLDMFVVATAFLLVVAALFATGRGRRLVFSLIRAPALPPVRWQ